MAFVFGDERELKRSGRIRCCFLFRPQSFSAIRARCITDVFRVEEAERAATMKFLSSVETRVSRTGCRGQIVDRVATTSRQSQG